MSFLQSTYNLFFDQKSFFENRNGLRVPIILTLVYAVVSTVAGIPIMMSTAAGIPSELFGMLVGITAVSSVISVVVIWFAVSAFFFACLKFIGYAECSYKQVLEVCGYVSAVLILQSVFTGLVSLIGVAPAVLLLLFEGVFLLWSIPVWYFGFASVCNIDEKKLRLSVAVPVIVMAVITSAGVILAL
ncbi:MAG TPA: YIP1 family protein [Methanocorpusculum sp.]|nr:YIP1 family protein [Methanocorpusculum sp.]